jgi:hypothetical protein
MASLYELCDILIKGDYFLTLNGLLKVVRDASIKCKFSFKVLYKLNAALYSPEFYDVD